MTLTRAAVAFALAAGLVAPAEAQVPADLLIRVERTRCFGACAIYSITVDARGRVRYNGVENVRVTGRQTSRLGPAIVAGLVATAERIGFFELRDSYRGAERPDGTIGEPPTDQPTTFITLTMNGRTKRIEDYYVAPARLIEFEHQIEDAARTIRWVYLDEEELGALKRTGWKASTDAGAALLQTAIESDDLILARGLIELGADIRGPKNNRFTPLRMAHSGEMVDLLVQAGANPNEQQPDDSYGRGFLQDPPLMYVENAGVAEALLRAGADVEHVDEGGHTAIFHSACGGDWRVVTILLDAGAKPAGGTGATAVECARRERLLEARLAHPRSQDVETRTVDDFDRVIRLLDEAPAAPVPPPATSPRR